MAEWLYDHLVPWMSRMPAHLRARTPLQLAAMLALVVVEVVGIVAIATGHRDLGRSLIGLGIVLLVPFLVWMRTTNPPG